MKFVGNGNHNSGKHLTQDEIDDILLGRDSDDMIGENPTQEPMRDFTQDEIDALLEGSELVKSEFLDETKETLINEAHKVFKKAKERNHDRFIITKRN